MQCNSERVAAGAIARNSHQGRVPQRGHLCRRIPLIPLNPTESRFKIKFCPKWKTTRDRDPREKSGLDPPAAFRPPRDYPERRSGG